MYLIIGLPKTDPVSTLAEAMMLAREYVTINRNWDILIFNPDRDEHICTVNSDKITIFSATVTEQLEILTTI